MSNLTDAKIFSCKDQDSNNFRVLNESDEFVNNIVVADEKTQSLLINKPDSRGNFIMASPGIPKLFTLNIKFKVVNVLSGKGDKSITELHNSGEGKRCFILGSGPSLDTVVKRVDLMEDDILISVNVRPLNYFICDYVVFTDRIVSGMLDDFGYSGPRISIWADLSDYYLDWNECCYWKTSFSSGLAVWLGCYFGCSDVILAGFDCYQGEAYIDDDRDATWKSYPLSLFTANWKEAFNHCSNPDRIKVIDSPLWGVFGEYNGT